MTLIKSNELMVDRTGRLDYSDTAAETARIRRETLASRRAFIAKQMPSIALDGKSEAYINAAFDELIAWAKSGGGAASSYALDGVALDADPEMSRLKTEHAKAKQEERERVARGSGVTGPIPPPRPAPRPVALDAAPDPARMELKKAREEERQRIAAAGSASHVVIDGAMHFVPPAVAARLDALERERSGEARGAAIDAIEDPAEQLRQAKEHARQLVAAEGRK